MPRALLIGLLLMLGPLVACTRAGPLPEQPEPPLTVTPAASLATPTAGQRFQHVAVIVMENREAPSILNNPAAPFINQLAREYRLAGRSYAIAHPSLPNYLALVAGSTFGIRTDCTDCLVTAPTVADQMEAAGRSWKAYLEDMPEPCALRDAGRYAVRHNPFVYFTAIRNNSERCRTHDVAFSAFATDAATGSLPDLFWIVPNLCNDMHDCDAATGDRWLAQQTPAILNAPGFGPDGLLLITWDEGTTAACCVSAAGGHIVTLAVSPRTRGAGEDDTPVTHYSLLRTVENAFALPPLGAAAQAVPLLR